MTSGEATQNDTQDNLEVQDDGFEDSMQRRWRIIWWSTLLGPIALTVAILSTVWAIYGLKYVRNLVLISVGTFFVAGRFIILTGKDGAPGSADEFFSSGQLFMMVMYMDFVCAMLLTFHMGFLFKMPVLGVKFKRLADDGRYIVKSFPWMRRATIAGIVAFVMFPLAATGSIGGSVLGRMLGLSRLTTFLCVMTGSVLGCGVMYYGAELIQTYFPKGDPRATWGGIALIAIMILILNNRYQKMKSLRREEEARESNNPS